MKKRNKDNSKSRIFFRKIWSQPKFFVPLSFILSTITGVFCEIVIFNSHFFTNYQYYSSLRLFAITVLSCGIINLCRYYKFFCQNLDKAFLLISLSIGLPSLLIFPQVTHVSPDDHVHFRNAFVLFHNEVHWSDGIKMLDAAIDTNTSGMSFDEINQLYQAMNEAHEQTRAETTEFIRERNVYSSLAYLPYHIGFEVSQFLHLSLVDMIIVAKIFNFLCYVLLIYFAIRVNKRTSKIFFAIGLITSNMFYATQFSCDPMIISSIMLAMALFFKMLEQDKVDPRLLFGFMLLVIWGSLPKAIYCLLLLLVFLIPNSKFDSRKRAAIFKGLAIVLVILMLSTFVLPLLSGGMGGDLRGGNTSASGQIKYILASPLQFTKTLMKFITAALPEAIFGQRAFINFPISNSIFGSELTYISQICYYVEFILVLWAAFSTIWPKKILSLSRKSFLIVLYIAVTLEIIGAMYISFNPVGYTGLIMGVQYRYFMPILPLFLTAIAPATERETRELRSQRSVFFPVLCWYMVAALPVILFILRASYVYM